MNCNGQKVSEYALVGQDDNGYSKIIGTYSILNKSVTYWDPGNLTFPPDQPECGFDLSKCPSKLHPVVKQMKYNVFFFRLRQSECISCYFN